MSIIGDFRVGETLSLALDALSGDPGEVSAIAAWIAPAEQRGGVASVREDAVRTALDVTTRAASGDVPAGWTLTLSAAASAALLPGLYGIDARLTVGGGVDITDASAFVRLTRSAAG